MNYKSDLLTNKQISWNVFIIKQANASNPSEPTHFAHIWLDARLNEA